MKKKVIVIGSNSLVGKAFVKKFSDEYSLTLITKANINDLQNNNEKYDTLVFLAQSNDYKSPTFTSDLFDVNVSLLFESVLNFKGRVSNIIYFSTGSVYDLTSSTSISLQSDIAHSSVSPYVISKLMAEKILATFNSEYNSIAILRPFFIYGKGQKSNMLIKSIYNRIVSNEKIKLSGKKGLIFNPVHCDDVAELITTILSADCSGLHVYNVAGNSVTNLYEISQMIGTLINKKVSIEVDGDTDSSIVAEVESILGWMPQLSIAEGLKRSFDEE